MAAEEATKCAKASERKPLVSVVVPVYKTASTLDVCVDALLHQTLAPIEIVLVDDGSPDECGALCDAWAERDARISVVHKRNGGLSDARNAGVRAARADRIAFVDSDDTVEPEMLETLYDDLVRTGSDLSLVGAVSHYRNEDVETPDHGFQVVSGAEALRLTLEGKIAGIWAVLRLYPKGLLLEVPFPIGRNFEDAYVTADIYLRATRVALNPRPLYHYWRRDDSISSASISAKSLDIVSSFDHMCAVAEQGDPRLREACDFRRLWARFDLLDRFAFLGEERNAEQARIEADLVTYLRAHTREIWGNSCFGRSRKAAMLLLVVSKRLYYASVRARDRNK